MNSVLSLDLRASLRSLGARLDQLRPLLHEQRHWLIGLLVVVPPMAMAAYTGYAALRQVEEQVASARHLEQVRARMESWVEGYRPATAAESLAWRRSEEALRPLSAPVDDVTALARLLSQRADEVGIEQLRVSLLTADSVAVPEPRALGPWRSEAGKITIAAEFEADYATIQSFIGVLPPQLEVLEFSIHEATEGELQTRFVLMPRQVKPEGA